MEAEVVAVEEEFVVDSEEAAVGFASARPTVDNCWGIKPLSPIFDVARGFEQIQLGIVGPPAFREAYAARCNPG